MTLIKLDFTSHKSEKPTFFRLMNDRISNLQKLGKIRTSETYSAALSSFRKFRNGRDLSLDEIDSDLLLSYETALKENGLSPNSISFYMRCLRASYNYAVDKGLTGQRYPFRHVYTGVGRTVKRAMPLNCIKAVNDMDISSRPWLEFARDMFMFSFFTRGMSLVDMAYLRKNDIKDGVLSYRRRKTGQQLFIKWERCMQDIVVKYDVHDSPYLLPLIKRYGLEERKQYIYAGHNINRNLKIIGRELDLRIPLTMYVARHSWASIARSKNISLSVISESMGHDSEKTTRIYLATLDNAAIDRANSLILNLF